MQMSLFWDELTRWWVDWNRCSECSRVIHWHIAMPNNISAIKSRASAAMSKGGLSQQFTTINLWVSAIKQRLLLILPRIFRLTVLCAHPNQLTNLTSCIFRDLFCLWKAATLWCLKVQCSFLLCAHAQDHSMWIVVSEVTFRTFTLPELLRFSNGKNEEIHN